MYLSYHIKSFIFKLFHIFFINRRNKYTIFLPFVLNSCLLSSDPSVYLFMRQILYILGFIHRLSCSLSYMVQCKDRGTCGNVQVLKNGLPPNTYKRVPTVFFIHEVLTTRKVLSSSKCCTDMLYQFE